MRIGEVVTEKGVVYVVTQVLWLGEEKVTKKPLSPATQKFVRSNYVSKIGEPSSMGIIVGEIIRSDGELEFLIGSNLNFDSEFIDSPLINHCALIFPENSL